MMRVQKAVALVVAVVVVLVIILSFVLDGILTSKAREQAQELSQEWGRPVRLGGVATKLLTGLGVRVSDVQIGAASGEDVPLVALERVEVRVALLRALFSGGKSVQVHSAEVQGLTVNVERLSDGTTNLQRFQDKLAESSEKKAKDEKQSDLSFLRVDHAALREGKVAFIDKATRGAKELAVQHLDVEVNDLRSGKPLEVLLKAAVLADKQNLEVRVKTAPLPVTLTPMPTSVALHVNPPIDIGPLGPFAGKDIGLESGTLDADFDAQLGAAVPGGSGPTAVKGVIKLAGLRFAGADGGGSRRADDSRRSRQGRGRKQRADPIRCEARSRRSGSATRAVIGQEARWSPRPLRRRDAEDEQVEHRPGTTHRARRREGARARRRASGQRLGRDEGRGSKGDEAVRSRSRLLASRSRPDAHALDEEEGEQAARSRQLQGPLRTREGADRAPDDEEADRHGHRRRRRRRGGPRQGEHGAAEGLRRDGERRRHGNAPCAPGRSLPPGDEARQRRTREPRRAGFQPQAGRRQVQWHHRPARRGRPGEDAGRSARRQRARRRLLRQGHPRLGDGTSVEGASFRSRREDDPRRDHQPRPEAAVRRYERHGRREAEESEPT